MGSVAQATWLDLYDYRKRVAAIYREREEALGSGSDPQQVLDTFRAAKDPLFREHPQSALSAAQRSTFTGLRYHPYNPAMRVGAQLMPVPQNDDVILAQDGEHALPMRRAARLDFTIEGVSLHLTVYWIDVYGGGLFLPFRDATCPDESYGGGRYLFDTVKGSDFQRLDSDETQGYLGGRVVLDFNYAYNPSCAYDSRWVCPLAPPENRLSVPIRAGERLYI